MTDIKRAFCYFPANAPADGFHYLDHLAPLAIELGLPLISRSEEQSDLISRYYPLANLEYIPKDVPLVYLKDPSVIISNAFRHQLEADLLYERMIFGQYESIYCPHGLSDKEMLYGKFGELDDDVKVLVYGDKMKGEVPSHCKPFILGNYRKLHFERFKPHYLSILEKDIQKLSLNRWTLLWSPSWIFDRIPGLTLENLSSIIESSLLKDSALEELRDEIQVIFKPHPYLLSQMPELLSQVKETAERSPNLIYLEKMPYIYPLFEKADAYLGDTSSVGYDFLATGKPVFSLSKNTNSPWQKLALTPPLKNNGIDWRHLRAKAKEWNKTAPSLLLQSGFSERRPLCEEKRAFAEFLSS